MHFQMWTSYNSVDAGKILAPGDKMLFRSLFNWFIQFSLEVIQRCYYNTLVWWCGDNVSVYPLILTLMYKKAAVYQFLTNQEEKIFFFWILQLKIIMIYMIIL